MTWFTGLYEGLGAGDVKVDRVWVIKKRGHGEIEKQKITIKKHDARERGTEYDGKGRRRGAQGILQEELNIGGIKGMGEEVSVVE